MEYEKKVPALSGPPMTRGGGHPLGMDIIWTWSPTSGLQHLKVPSREDDNNRPETGHRTREVTRAGERTQKLTLRMVVDSIVTENTVVN